jgi:hypothetical protein
MFWNDIKEMKEWMVTIASRLTDLQMKMDGIIQEQEDRDSIDQLAAKTIDKCQDYMKNVEKLNSMINELKGCVALARSALEERKNIEKIVAICQKEEKKSPKKRKTVKKKGFSVAPESE